MDHVVVLVLQRVVARTPREKVVVERRGRTVVATEGYGVGAGDARTHLRVGVLAAALCGDGHAHKELVPANDVQALA